MTEGIGRAAAGLALLLLLPNSAAVQPVHVVEFRTLVDGPNAQYVVQFDGAVDHERSRVSITQGDRVVATLRPVLRAEPNVLATSGPLLEPGTYELRWAARSMRNGEVTEGSIPFTVRK